MNEKDPACLWDMLEAAQQIVNFTRGVSFHKYNQNLMMQSAVERQLEILGEAARHVSTALQEEHPEIPWRSMIGLRNILAHEYGDVKADRIWAIAKSEVAELIPLLKPIIPPAEE